MLRTGCARCSPPLIARAARYSAESEAAFAAIVRESQLALTAATTDLSETAHRLARRTHAAVERADERLAMRIDTLAPTAPAALRRADGRLDTVQTRLLDRATAVVDRAGDRLEVVAARVGAVDPAVQLARGWSITRRRDGSVIRSVSDVSPDEPITTAVADGVVTSTVTDTATVTEQKD